MEFNEDELHTLRCALNLQITALDKQREADPRAQVHRTLDTAERVRDRISDVLSNMVGEYDDAPRGRGDREDFHSDG